MTRMMCPFCLYCYGIVGGVLGIGGTSESADGAVSGLGQGGLVKGFKGLIPTGQGREGGVSFACAPAKVLEAPSDV